MFKVSASQISESIDIDSFKGAYTAELLYADHVELFYEVDTEIYVAIFKYGVVCFFNADETIINEVTNTISQHCQYFYDSELTKAYQIEPNANELKFGFNKAEITYFDIEALRVIMLNIAQSVALDYYFQKARILLEETNKYTSILEKTGKLSISDKEIKKFIGQTHNLKNQIVENLHIFDSAPETQQSDYLIKMDYELKLALYMEKRSKSIHEELQIIREHLEYFSGIMSHGASMRLEWIVIVLLAIFVIDVIIRRLS
jgi:uncharacterized Rmd1/YagE family protein